MANPVLTGAVLIEANGAALNMSDESPGSARTDIGVAVKQIRIGRLRYPYVSGQAWRRWWREVLYADFNWQPSEVTREAKSAYTKGDPIAYEEDDLFGYMAARKRAKKSKRQTDQPEEESADGKGTSRRISPLKNSLLISVLPNVIERDFGHFSRNLKPGEDIIPFESEHYTTYLQGVFTLSLADVGRFIVGEMRDLSKEVLEAHKSKLKNVSESVYQMPREECVRRAQQVTQALAQLRGGAHLARNLSDVTPVAVLVGFLDGGNAPFQRMFEPDESNERVRLNLTRLRSVLNDYEDRLLIPKDGEKPRKPLYFGYRPTVLANETEVLNAFQSEKPFSEAVTILDTPQQALEEAAEALPLVFDQHVR